MVTLKRSNIFFLITFGRSSEDVLANRLRLRRRRQARTSTPFDSSLSITEGAGFAEADGDREEGYRRSSFFQMDSSCEKRSLFYTVSLLFLTSRELRKDPESMRYR